MSTWRYVARVCAVLAGMGWAGAGLWAQHSYSPADIEDGGRLYQANCARCHGPDGDVISGVNLGRGQFRRVTTDDEIVRTIISGVAGTGMPPSNFSDAEAGTIVAYLRTMATGAGGGTTMPGESSRGREIFEGTGRCSTCHALNGRGSRFGPDLGDIGSFRRAVELERAILDPDAEVQTDFRFVRAVTLEGTTIRGRLLNQDSSTIQLFDANERLVSLTKASLRESEILKTSAMPSYRTTLTAQEVADVVTYLRSLKGGP